MTLRRIAHAEAVKLITAGDAILDCDLADVRWRELPVPEVRLKGCVLADGDLADAELGDASFVDCTFHRCSFASATLSGSVWQRSVLFESDPAAGCRFTNADLDGAQFEECNLSMCSFEGASLTGLSMKAGKATGADFTDASFTRRKGKALVAAVHFSGVALDLATFAGLTLDEADFAECSLRQADFSGSTLSDAVFRGIDGTEINVSGATLDKADFREARLEGVNLAAAKSFRAIKVSQSQLATLANSLGIRVFPD